MFKTLKIFYSISLVGLRSAQDNPFEDSLIGVESVWTNLIDRSASIRPLFKNLYYKFSTVSTSYNS